MGVTLEQGTGWSTLRLEGAIDISLAAELKQLLMTAVAQGGEVRVDLGGATDLDVTAVQLLMAAERKAKGAGVGFAYSDVVPQQILSALSEAGLQQIWMAEKAA